MKKLIISVAVTGSATLPSQTPYLPLTPKQIADEVYKSWEAGASIAHIHARNPKTGEPTADIAVYKQILTDIKKRCDIVICITTGGALGMTPEDRIRVVPTFKPELSSFNMGSMNFCLTPVLKGIKEFKYEWEKKYVDITYRFPFTNTFSDLEYFCKVMEENQTKPECEIYDVGHLYNLAYLVQKNVLKDEPIWMQFVTGTLGGIGRDIEDLLYLVHVANRLFRQKSYEWSVIGVGYPWEFQAATLAVLMGGHVRVGLEDNIYIDEGNLAKTNAQLVKKVVRIANELGRDVATPSETRKMLGLKGSNKVNF